MRVSGVARVQAGEDLRSRAERGRFGLGLATGADPAALGFATRVVGDVAEANREDQVAEADHGIERLLEHADVGEEPEAIVGLLGMVLYRRLNPLLVLPLGRDLH